ncbi:DUF1479-domain-containing protein [Coleophoma cylindrospora]|uniref:DUF1479-domain-containing protein n=1 Tax=Coleophoma cylindrospora TaxID=1849047 RepID=A0A3D8RGD1_9HELO|nr:DUF1479-domain-containing protein [Coleophoma cylindrospora]
MLSAVRSSARPTGLKLSHPIIRNLATQTQKHAPKKEGDISSVFASLSGAEAVPLPARFADIKRSLVANHEPAVVASWTRLLSTLRSEIELISEAGSDIIPTIEYSELNNHSRIQPFSKALSKRGVAVIRGVIPEEEVLQWKADVRDYVVANPQTKAFPADNPAVYELYWSPTQIKARAHPNMVDIQRFLMGFWHSDDKNAMISTEHPLAYADRVRIRMPGDAGFALGPHVDGGSAERWEPNGYGLGGPYNKVFEGAWEGFDPWESSSRLQVESDLYNGPGACSMFRMYQGWLSMSTTGPGEGALLVNPMLQAATAYYLLRPFFSPINADPSSSSFLDASNWAFDSEQTPLLQGATLGMAQELNNALHPHLDLEKTMVHVPRVQPGDYVAWHCDTIHAVDKIHNGTSDSSVLYIPACPMTEANARYLVRQRDAFLEGTPAPDFPGGVGESKHVGRPETKDVEAVGGMEGLRAFGLAKWDVGPGGGTVGRLLRSVNGILG